MDMYSRYSQDTSNTKRMTMCDVSRTRLDQPVLTGLKRESVAKGHHDQWCSLPSWKSGHSRMDSLQSHETLVNHIWIDGVGTKLHCHTTHAQNEDKNDGFWENYTIIYICIIINLSRLFEIQKIDLILFLDYIIFTLYYTSKSLDFVPFQIVLD